MVIGEETPFIGYTISIPWLHGYDILILSGRESVPAERSSAVRHVELTRCGYSYRAVLHWQNGLYAKPFPGERPGACSLHDRADTTMYPGITALTRAVALGLDVEPTCTDTLLFE